MEITERRPKPMTRPLPGAKDAAWLQPDGRYLCQTPYCPRRPRSGPANRGVFENVDRRRRPTGKVIRPGQLQQPDRQISHAEHRSRARWGFEPPEHRCAVQRRLGGAWCRMS